MPRPVLEVADILRRHGDVYRERNASHLSRDQLKVMGAVHSCRTAALGGHVERCGACGHSRIAYNSCPLYCARWRVIVRWGQVDFVQAGLLLARTRSFTPVPPPILDKAQGRPSSR